MSNEKEVKGGVETTNPPAEISVLNDNADRPTSVEYELKPGGLKKVPLEHALDVSIAARRPAPSKARRSGSTRDKSQDP